MKVVVKQFKELTTKELYQLLELRSEVFVVEQACVYQDVDGKDQSALHILLVEDEKLLAYTRIFGPGVYFKKASFGRVAVAFTARNKGLGKKIVAKTIEIIEKKYPNSELQIAAQTYLIRFYEAFDFKTVGMEYLEDGIPHVKMVRVIPGICIGTSS